MLHATIMAGGGGTRFWPRSRTKRPKQFLALAGERVLLQQAYDRIEASVTAERCWVITAAMHSGEVSRLLPEIPARHIIGEPIGRDTAACIGLGAALLAREDADATMLVMPADHLIAPDQEFRRAVQVGAQMVEDHPDCLVTFGIPPTHPATGYGYVHYGEPFAERQGVRVFQVRGFREKPAVELAEQMISSGEYFWNSGIFVWKAATILNELRQNQPQVVEAIERITQAWDSPAQANVFQSEYEKLEKISIDYAVMERARHVLVVQSPFTWDDVGSWLALERMNPQDAEGNTILANHCGMHTQNCVIVGEDASTLIATLGVDNLLIVQDGDAILVADRREEGAVRQLVDLLKKKGLTKYL